MLRTDAGVLWRTIRLFFQRVTYCKLAIATDQQHPWRGAIPCERFEATSCDSPLERAEIMTSEFDERLLRLRDVKQKTGLGTSTIYRRIADGTFPIPRSLGPNTVRWLQSEIDTWIEALPPSRLGGTTP